MRNKINLMMGIKRNIGSKSAVDDMDSDYKQTKLEQIKEQNEQMKKRVRSFEEQQIVKKMRRKM